MSTGRGVRRPRDLGLLSRRQKAGLLPGRDREGRVLGWEVDFRVPSGIQIAFATVESYLSLLGANLCKPWEAPHQDQIGILSLTSLESYWQRAQKTSSCEYRSSKQGGIRRSGAPSPPPSPSPSLSRAFSGLLANRRTFTVFLANHRRAFTVPLSLFQTKTKISRTKSFCFGS